jgi:hypothetical protein
VCYNTSRKHSHALGNLLEPCLGSHEHQKNAQFPLGYKSWMVVGSTQKGEGVHYLNSLSEGSNLKAHSQGCFQNPPSQSALRKRNLLFFLFGGGGGGGGGEAGLLTLSLELNIRILIAQTHTWIAKNSEYIVNLS